MSDLRAPDTSRPLAWLRPKRRRQRDAPFRYLLDSRLFRRFTTPGGEAALAGFRASVARLGLGPGEGLPALELTPMAFLEVIGVDPPHFDFFPLPAEVLKSGESLKATTLVVTSMETRFRRAPEIQPDVLKKRVEELRQTMDPAVYDLFDLCVTRILSREGFQEQVFRQLAFDFLYRFPFPDVLREEVFDFLCASLFGTEDSVAGLSKMRVIKVLWDRAYPRLLKANPGLRGEIQALDREMKPRTRADYLAFELVHHSVLGLAAKNRFRPVTAFTLEPEERVKARAIAYKSALRSFLDQISRSDLETLRPNLEAWKPGALVPCQEDGTFEVQVPVGDLPVFGGEKKMGPTLERPGSESTPEPSGAEVSAE
ncbi:MAG TPA: hypothetical protein VFC23_21150 [Thermoanaerobaculia bacterium]|nr:hypothetical protein [Thermoanaerobaculia bacterium]